MFGKVDAFLSAQSRVRLTVGCVALIAAIGALDHLTGYELSFSIFYLFPIGIFAWYAGQPVGLLISIVSAATWLAVDFTSGHPYSLPALAFWNAAVRFAFFAVTAVLLGRLRGAHDVQVSLARNDGLTGIPNARAFEERWVALAPLAARHGHPVALGYLDVDGFKSVNDTLGHSVGDQVLKAVATELAGRVRASDFVGRLGGDEFAVALSETDASGARTFFAGIHENLLRLAAHNGWPIGFSIGVAVFQSPPANLDDAIRAADALMYRVKGSGRNSLLIEEYPGGDSRGMSNEK